MTTTTGLSFYDRLLFFDAEWAALYVNSELQQIKERLTVQVL
jgi:hypothetical protein